LNVIKDRGFQIALLMTFLIGFGTYYSISKKGDLSSKDHLSRVEVNSKSLSLIRSTSEKLDEALGEAEATSLMLESIMHDLDEINEKLEDARGRNEKKANTTQDP